MADAGVSSIRDQPRRIWNREPAGWCLSSQRYSRKM